MINPIRVILKRLYSLHRIHKITNGVMQEVNPLNPELNPICCLLALLAHHFLHVSRIRVKSLTLRQLMSYTYGAPILDVSRSHTTTQHSR
jgi:transposase